jgi:hypothetical protein
MPYSAFNGRVAPGRDVHGRRNELLVSTQLRRSGAYQLVPKPVVAGAYVSTVLDDFSRCVSALVAISLNKGSFLPASLLIVLLP